MRALHVYTTAQVSTVLQAHVLYVLVLSEARTRVTNFNCSTSNTYLITCKSTCMCTYTKQKGVAIATCADIILTMTQHFTIVQCTMYMIQVQFILYS